MKSADIARDVVVPEAPFTGFRHRRDIDTTRILALVNRQALFRGRWGYRRGKMSAADYDGLISGEVEPIYAELCEQAVRDNLVTPRVAYGYFRCWSEENVVCVTAGDTVFRFPFPRQAEPPHLCIADYFHTEAEGGDIAGFFVVSIGPEIGEETARLFAADRYHDYMMMHGFSVEVTDALAEYWHAVMRHELGIDEVEPGSLQGYVTQGYRGARYGFGYPACPDLEAHREIFQMLRPEEIGVTLTEGMQMVPEQSTSAIVAHHPQAKYFAV